MFRRGFLKTLSCTLVIAIVPAFLKLKYRWNFTIKPTIGKDGKLYRYPCETANGLWLFRDGDRAYDASEWFDNLANCDSYESCFVIHHPSENTHKQPVTIIAATEEKARRQLADRIGLPLKDLRDDLIFFKV